MTIEKDFFIENKPIIYWRLEVIYSFASKTSVQTFDIELNEIPKSGICSIHPLTGTIITLFNITCSNWFDVDGIKDYIIYGLLPSFLFQITENQFIKSMVGRMTPHHI